MSRRHHRITRITLPERPLAEWFGMFGCAAIYIYAAAVFVVNVVSLP